MLGGKVVACPPRTTHSLDRWQTLKTKPMKQLTTLFVLFTACTPLFAQFPTDPETGKVVYTDVIELPEMDKKAIYEKAKLWMVSTLKSSDSMTELSNEESDQLIGTGNLNISEFKVPSPMGTYLSRGAVLNFKVLIFCKDGRFKYVLENFTFNYLDLYGNVQTDLIELKPSASVPKKKRETFKEMATENINGNIVSLINDLIAQMKSNSNGDW